MEEYLSAVLGDLIFEVDAVAVANGWDRAEAVRFLIGAGLRSEEELAEIRSEYQHGFPFRAPEG